MFQPLVAAPPPKPGASGVTIRVTRLDAPWPDDVRTIEYYPSENLLLRGSRSTRATDELVAFLEDDVQVAAERPRRLSWPAAIVLAGLLGVGGWLGVRLLVRGRGPGAPPR